MRKNVLKRLAGAAVLAAGVLLLAAPMTAHAASNGTTIDLSDASPPGSGTGWTYSSSQSQYTISNGADVTVTGNNNGSGRRLLVSADATASITLDGVTINGVAQGYNPLIINTNANVTLTLVGENTLNGNGSSVINTFTGARSTLTISGTGSLTCGGGITIANVDLIVNGGTVTATGGINYRNDTNGSVTINGGTVTATGTLNAGISVCNIGTFTVNGGTVTATGGSDGGAGIGGNRGYSTGSDQITYSGGTITINGGTVTATGGSNGGAGIGSGINNAAANGSVTISGGTVVATSQEGDDAIGNGRNGSGNTVNITGNALVFANSVAVAGTKTSGIVAGATTNWLGASQMIIDYHAVVPSGRTLTIDSDKTLAIAGGAALTNNGTITNNGEIIYEDDGSITGNAITPNAPKKAVPPAVTITPAAVTGVSTPTAGNTASATINATGEYTASLVWSNDKNIISTIFASDAIYTARITLAARAGYDFAGLNDGNISNFTVNGHAPTFVSNTSNQTLVFDVTFPKTGIVTGSIDLSTSRSQPASGTGWTYASSQYTIHGGVDVTVTGSNTWNNQLRIVIADDATAKITLDNVTLAMMSGALENPSPLNIGAGASLTVELVGTNTLTATSNGAGILVPSGASLVIGGTGSLTATGGNNGAGIGGVNGTTVGTITINGGTVIATKGGSSSHNDIGNGNSGSGASVNITGNALIFANSVASAGTKSGGIVAGTSTTWYGETITLDYDAVIPAGRTLTIPSGKTLVIDAGKTFTNYGTLVIANGSTVTNNGTVIPADGSTVTISGTRGGSNLFNGANISGTAANSGKSHNTLTIDKGSLALAATTGQGIEYAVNTSADAPNTGWQDGLTFEGLTHATQYHVFARSKENSNYSAGAAVELYSVITTADNWIYYTQEWTTGDGTSGNPYQISIPGQLAKLADHVKNGNNCSGTYFKLTDDIDISGKEWTPIGYNPSLNFRGIFDGGGHTISNITINEPGKEYQGLFGYFGGNATAEIKNLIITGNITGKSDVGGLIGYGDIGTVRNVVNYVDVTAVYDAGVTGSGNRVGGIVGSYAGSLNIYECANMGSVTGYEEVGGIFGFSQVSTRIIQNSFNAGRISGYAYVGGISGYIITGQAGSSAAITNCYNIGEVSASSKGFYAMVGGLVGSASSVQFTDSYNAGPVWGVGGRIGAIVGSDGTIINTSFTNVYFDSDVLAGFTPAPGFFKPGFACGSSDGTNNSHTQTAAGTTLDGTASLTTAEMITPSNFASSDGWVFFDAVINALDNTKYDAYYPQSSAIVTLGGQIAAGSRTSVTRTFARGTQTAPSSAPTLESKTATSVTLTANAAFQYRLGTMGTWQDSNVFEELDPNTPYTFYARIKETVTLLASDASDGFAATTDRLTASPTVSMADWTFGAAASDPVINDDGHDGVRTIRYIGIDGTEYDSETRPTNAGKYRIEVTYAQGDRYNAVLAAVTDTFEITKATLAGTVTISGGAVFGETLSAVTSALTSDPDIGALGALSYQWAYDGQMTQFIPTATSATYTLGEEDIGKVIMVRVNAANAMGYKWSDATAAVGKATPAAPLPPTMASKTTTSITLTVIPGAKYSIDNGATWQDAVLFSGLTPNTAYTFVARLEATATHNMSAVSAASAAITTDPLMYAVSITAPTNGTLSVMDGAAEVATGTQVAEGTILTITAEAAAGYVLTSLTVNDVPFTSGQTHAVISAVSIVAAFTLIPVDDPVTYMVTFKDHDGTAIGASQTVNHGEAATAPAVNPTRVGYTFTGWLPATFTNITADLDVIAQYTINSYAVTFAAPVNGTLSVWDASGQLQSGDVVTYNTNIVITATAATGYQLSSLTVNDVQFSSGQTHTVIGAVSIVAAFTLIPVVDPVTYLVTVAGTTSGTGGGSYKAGDTVWIASGTPPRGERFVKWSAEGAAIVDSTRGKTSFIMPAVAVTVTAVFEPNTVSIAAGPNVLAKSAVNTGIFYEGGSFKTADLSVYDVMGNVITKIKVSDPRDTETSRKVGDWDLRGKNGQRVNPGTYLIKGTITTIEGGRERVSEKVLVK